MKITGGIFKGQKIYYPPSKIWEIRPLRTRIRKAIFDILGQDLDPSWNVLDLFCGTGAVGIEAISRGANFAVFVDHSRLSISIVKKNIEKFRIQEKTEVLQLKLPKGLKKIAQRYSHFFNLVFIMPPYKQKLALKTLESLSTVNLLAEDPIIVVEEHREAELPEKVSIFVCIDKRLYGESIIYFYKIS